MTSVAVVVPTFRRPDALAACLEALRVQHRAPDEVVVVTRTDDPDAPVIAAAAGLLCTVLELDEPGVLAAMVAGVRATTAGVICFTDDDAVVPATWVAQIAAALEEHPLVGGIGGRDVIIDAGGVPRTEPLTTDVGRVTWFGRHVGNHHIGTGEPRDVGFLKGVNSGYRREALGLPRGLRGTGAQAHFEIAVGRFARSRGWRLVYDPALAVEHHPAARQGADQRDEPTRRAVADAAYNLVVAMGGVRGACRFPYAIALGDRGAPGLLRAAVAAAQGDHATVARLSPSLRGTTDAAAALLGGRGVTYETFA